MTKVVSLSKVDLGQYDERHAVLRAISSSSCEIDYRVRNGVYGKTLEHAISKLASILDWRVGRIKRFVDDLMREGLIGFVKNRLFVRHKTGRSPAYRRALVKKGKAVRVQLALEAVRPTDPDWDPEALSEDELDYAAWAAQIHTPTSPAGGWDGCCAHEAAIVIDSVRRRAVERIVVEGIHSAGTFYPGSTGLMDDIAAVADSQCAPMMDTADLVGVLVDGERELDAAGRLGL